MIYKNVAKTVFILIIYSIIAIESVSALDNTYSDNFNNLDLSIWEPITTDTWNTVNGTVYSEGSNFFVSRPGLIYNGWEGINFVSEIEFTMDDTVIKDHGYVGFYFYYKDSHNYGRISFVDDNREENVDSFVMDSELLDYKYPLINTQVYIHNFSNNTFMFKPDQMHRLKIVRLNKYIYVIYNYNLIAITELVEEDLSGKVGPYVYASTGYFDNFYLRPITMENASNYINELNLTSANPTTRIGSIYTLGLEDTANGNAFFSLSKFGKSVDTAVGSEGDTVSLSFENGDEAVNFKVTQVFDAGNNSVVWLEDIISASTDDLNIGVDGIAISPSHYQGEDMAVRFSVKNLGGIRYTGTPQITISTDGDSKTINQELDLTSGESEEFRVALKAPQKQGGQKVTVAVKTEYSTIEKSVDYQVRVLNPAVTTLSADLQEDNGIRGVISISSPFSAELVDWNMTAVVKVYKLVENGKKEIYSMDVPVKGSTFNIALGYNKFYSGDGQYIVTVDAGGMQDSDFFEIMGDDFVYAPGGDQMPPTILTGELYPKLMMLLIGMFAAVSVRNHMHKATRSLPLDILAVVCGIGVLMAGFVRGESDIVTTGIVLTGTGIGAAVVKRSDSAVGKMLLMDSHLHDFVGMLVVFASAGYIVMQVPEWSFMMVVGTLVGYYTALNLYRGTGDE